MKTTKKSKLKVRKGYVDGGDIDPATLPQDVYSEYLKAPDEAAKQAIVANYKASQAPAPVVNTAQNVVNNVASVIPSAVSANKPSVGVPNIPTGKAQAPTSSVIPDSSSPAYDSTGAPSAPKAAAKSGPSLGQSNSYAGMAATGLSYIPIDEPEGKIDHTTTASQVGDTIGAALPVGGFLALGDTVATGVEDATSSSDSELTRTMGHLNAGAIDPWGAWKKTIDGYGKDSVGTSIGKTALDLFAPGMSNIWSGAEDDKAIAAAKKAKFANTVDVKKVQSDANYVSRSGDRRSTGRNVDIGDTASLATGGPVEGPGTAKSDSIDTSLPKGFVVPAENAAAAKAIRKQYLGKGIKIGPSKDKKGEKPVKLSDGEHFFTEQELNALPPEVKQQVFALAPDAENTERMNKGGRVGYKNAGKVTPPGMGYYMDKYGVVWAKYSDQILEPGERELDINNPDDYKLIKKVEEEWVPYIENQIASTKSPSMKEDYKKDLEIQKEYLKTKFNSSSTANNNNPAAATPVTATAQPNSPLAKAPVTKIGAQGNTGIANPVLQIGAPTAVPAGTPVINAVTPATTPKINPGLTPSQQAIVNKAKGPQGSIAVPTGGPMINTGVTPIPYSVASGAGVTPAMTPLINAPTATTPAVEPPKSNNGTLTYALAGLQGALGIANAISNKQPDMKDTSAFEHRMQKAMANNTGLSEEEKKKFTDGATRAASTLARYGAGITGNSSEAFGMAKTALGGLSDKMLDMNVADQQLKRENINRGDRAANSLLDLDKFKFNIENERYQQNAATSAQMIDSSISNVIGNEQYLAALDRYDKRQSTWR